ncbi:hypothetical protein COCOBI_08-5980 [Coccomyxa sp. Obi]|nr:hypothetical protein COCOBI_08-5980 [Coccomyxa sp. Obi]
MPALAQVGLHPAARRNPRGSARFRGERAKFYGPLPQMVSMPQVKLVAISRPGHMLEHPSWTGPDQDMLQRALVAMCRCKSLDETLGEWDYEGPMPAHDSAISYVDAEGMWE